MSDENKLQTTKAEVKAITTAGPKLDAIEMTLMKGDLALLSTEQRKEYYGAVCESLGLNRLTQPFAYINLSGKLTLYARKEATEQLRKIYDVSVVLKSRESLNDLYIVTATARLPNGRTDEATGVISIANLKGENLANAVMKAECVPTSYEILTREGFKSPHELETDDLAASFNMQKKCLEWVPIDDVKFYNSRVVKEFAGNVTSFEFTEGHKWLTETDTGNLCLKPFEEIGENEKIRLSANMEDDVDTIDISPAEASVFGWIITDGTIKCYKQKLYRASICQSKSENFDSIRKSLNDCNFKFTESVTDNRKNGWMNQHWWYISSKDTQQLFSKLGFYGSEDLPRIAARLPGESRRAMLAAMLQADGDKKGIFGKGDINKIHCFQILSTLEGRTLRQTKVRFLKPSEKPFFLTGAVSYQKIVRKYLLNCGERITDVWCPTTKHGTWIMRSPDGQIAITGNTKAKRRVTLSICGLGLLDESEVSNVDHDGYVSIEQAHGVATMQKPEVLEAPKAAPVKPEPVAAQAPSQPAAPAPASPVPPPPPSVNQPKRTEGQSPYVTYPEDLPPDAPRAGKPTPAPNEAPAPKISQAQVKRLYTIASSSGWKDAGLKQFLKEALDLDSTLQLSPKHYDWLCSVVEKHSFEQAMETLRRAQAGKAEAQDANH